MEDTQTHDTGVIREKQADEVCDIYDIYGNRTGKTFVRGEPLSDGQYVMVVDVWIVNSKDEILIQKRSDLKKDLPGTWATHSGCVLAGESSQQACIREPLEEIGIHILPSQVHKLNRKVRGKLLSENFVVEQDFDTADAVLQTEEVSQIKWVSVSQLKQMAGHREFTVTRNFLMWSVFWKNGEEKEGTDTISRNKIENWKKENRGGIFL